jgi:hypothetical protein
MKKFYRVLIATYIFSSSSSFSETDHSKISSGVEDRLSAALFLPFGSGVAGRMI